MDKRKNGEQTYICPMHSGVRRQSPGNCPKCGMALLPEGTRFGMLRHIMSRPLHIVMAGVMLALMAAVMMMIR